MEDLKRIIISGGGTGGHIYPALALYRELKKNNPTLEVLYVGTERGLESHLVPAEGLPFKTIKIQGLVRSLSIENIKTAWYLFKAIRASRKIIQDFKPQAVIGTGGYVCGPVLYAAAKMDIPTLIHEQNSIPGISNKLLARYVDRIAQSFESSAPHFSQFQEKLHLTGNPRGQEVLTYAKEDNYLSTHYGLSDHKPTVLIFGGSRGAPAINRAALEALNVWEKSPYQVIIVTGEVHYEELLEEYQITLDNLAPNVRILPYVHNMPALFQAIDLVVARSGATSLAEFTSLGLASILIPSPYVTANHQEHNAQALVDQGAAEMIKEEDLTALHLAGRVSNLLEDPLTLDEMSKAARVMGITDASNRIERLIKEML